MANKDFQNGFALGTAIKGKGTSGIEPLDKTVTFKVDNTDYQISSVKNGVALSAPVNPTKTGYYFNEWQKNGVEVAFPRAYADITDGENLTAYFSDWEVHKVFRFDEMTSTSTDATFGNIGSITHIYKWNGQGGNYRFECSDNSLTLQPGEYKFVISCPSDTEFTLTPRRQITSYTWSFHNFTNPLPVIGESYENTFTLTESAGVTFSLSASFKYNYYSAYKIILYKR